jgi:hypothetical protein
MKNDFLRYNKKMFQNATLNPAQIHSVISENKYQVNQNNAFTSRCIDGRYENAPSLPALAIPGADIGELAILYSTARQYNFEVNPDKALETLQELVGKNNVNFHTDEHGDKNILGSGCGHLKQLRLDPEAFNLTHEDIETLENQIVKLHTQGAKETLLKGNHQEGAVVFITGGYGIFPQHLLEVDSRKINTQLFIFHSTLVNSRHRAWTTALIESGAVKLMDNLDEEYLYEVLSNTTEEHLFEISKRLAKDLPIYHVTFDSDGSFAIEQQGFV